MRCNTMQWPTAVLTAAGTALLLTALPGFPVPVYLPMLAAGAAALSAVLTAGKKWAWAVSAGWMLAAAAALWKGGSPFLLLASVALLWHTITVNRGCQTAAKKVK